MSKPKYAVFTMDVEAFSDTDCLASYADAADVDVMDGFDAYMEILDKHGIKSTLFTIGTLAPKVEDRLKQALSKGHRLALHGLHHTAPMNMPLEVFRQEIASAKATLSRMFGTEVQGYRAPCFSLDNDRLNVLRELGFTYDSSNIAYEKARHTVKLDLSSFTHYGDGIFHDKGFFEFSISKQKVFGMEFPISGGGYLRLPPWTFIKNFVRQYLEHSNYYVFYLHPFELTRQKIPHFKGLKSYDQYYLHTGVQSYGRHIEQIILMLKNLGYTFVTFEQLQETLCAHV